MKTTTRQMTMLQATALEPTSALGPAPDPRRPLLPDAPEWFNRARVHANQRQTLGLDPIPLARNCFVPYGGAAGRWRIRNRMIALGLLLVAVPFVFLMGFWTRGVVVPVRATRSAATRAMCQFKMSRRAIGKAKWRSLSSMRQRCGWFPTRPRFMSTAASRTPSGPNR